MKPEEAKTAIDAFLKQGREACEVARSAAKHRKSLSGDNFYADKFHRIVIALSNNEAKLKRLAVAGKLEESEVSSLSSSIETLKSTNTIPNRVRADAYKQISLICQSVLLPSIESLTANPIPETEQVLPMAVVEGTRGYIEKVVIQANGCYEHGWYDACAVMIRRLAETLIIEVYEKHKKEADIQDRDGNYLMLSHLVDKILADKTWNLGRETKQALPQLKSLGDRSAHNRHYLAKKGDIDKVLHGLRVVVDDLLHKAGLK
jgi:hypothetical protein